MKNKTQNTTQTSNSALESRLKELYQEVTGNSGEKKSNTELLEDTIWYLKNIIVHLPGHIYWLSKDNIFLGCNNLQAKKAELNSPNEIIGKTNFDLPWKDQAEALNEVNNKVMKTGNSIKIEENAVMMDENNLPTLGTYLSEKAPLYDKAGKPIGILGVSIDITEQKELEEKLRQETERANKATEKAEFESRHKSQFISDMQHDIRTPTSGLFAPLGILAGKEEDPGKKNVLHTLEASAKKLHNICNKVIEFDKAQQGAIPIVFTSQHIRGLASEIVALDGAAAFHKMIDLTWHVEDDVPTVLRVDEYRLEKILMNLVGNALKFTPEGGAISLTVRTTTRAIDDWPVFAFEVKDTGIGFDDTEKERIFEKFVRLNPSNTGIYEGSGLGLSMVKRFVDDLKGEIDVSSQKGHGSVFTVTIPCAVVRTAASEEIQPTASTVATAPVRLLFVEDDPVARMVGEDMLKKAGYNIDTATTVAEAKTFLMHQHYQFVLSDIGLPDGKGMDILIWLKSHSSHLNSHVPFVALTAHSAPETIQEALTCGFIEVLNKPFPFDRIQALVKQHALPAQEKAVGALEGDIGDISGEGLPCPLDEIIDMEASLKMAGGDALVLKKIVRMLGDLLPPDLLELEKLRDRNDIELTRKLLHTLDGRFRICIVPRLQKARTELHEAARNTDKLSQLQSLYDLFYKELDIFMMVYEKLKQYGKI